MEFTIISDQECYKEFNGHKCVITNPYRTDGYLEVYIKELQTFILLKPCELDGDE